MALEFYESSVSSPSGASAGVFIPVGDLKGVNSGDFASANSKEQKTAQALSGMLLNLNKNLPSGALGFSTARTSISSGTDLKSYTYSATPQVYIDHSDRTMKALPVPQSGANSGVGKVLLTDIFPSASKITSDGAIAGEGVLVPSADISPFGAPDHASVDPANDSRLWLFGFLEWMTVSDSITVRANGNASAITGRTRGTTSAGTLPGDATADTDPTTNLTSDDLNKISIISHSFSATIEFAIDPDNETIDVNVTS